MATPCRQGQSAAQCLAYFFAFHWGKKFTKYGQPYKPRSALQHVCVAVGVAVGWAWQERVSRVCIKIKRVQLIMKYT